MSGAGLKFLLNLPSPDDGEGHFTTAEFAVLVDDEPVWPAAGAEGVFLEIQIDDLLSHLAEFWKPLLLRQTYPIAVSPRRPMELRAKADERWEKLPEVAEHEDALVCAFEEAHDLSSCFAGYFDLPPLWLLRSGDRFTIDTRAGARTSPFEQAWAETSRLGDEIADHLACRPDRWSNLIDSWRRRDIGEPSTLLAWVTSLDPDTATKMIDDGILSAPVGVVDAANDNDELRIAARMASALPAEQIRQILTLIRTFGKSSAPDLDRLGEWTTRHVCESFASRRAHEQGEAAARFVRENLGLPSQSAVDMPALLSKLGVSLEPRGVEPSSLEALAIWGDRFGPAVLLNSSSRRGVGRAANVTLAHELCHLLLDRGHALGAVDILNSRMPPDVERRAKSFAGELLLPSATAAEAWRLAHCPASLVELTELVQSLANDFEVTRSVAAWKLDHAARQQGKNLEALLDQIAPHR
jgi:Zn-dependent peptidase ImmA (M78 family)